MGTRLYLGNLPHRARDRDVERFFKGYGRIRDVVLKNGYGFVEFDDYRDADDAVYELNGKSLLGERGPRRDGGRSSRISTSRRPSWMDRVLVEKARGSPRRGGGAGGGGGGGGRRDFRDNRGYGGDRDRGNGGGRQRGRENFDNSGTRPYGPPVRTENKLIVENLSSRVSWQDLKDYMRQAGEVTYADAHRPHKNEGVVEFANYSDMKNALEKLDDTEINGRRIKLVEDKPRRGSKRSRSRSRSPSGSRSRSRSRSRSNRSKSNSRSRSRSRSVSRSRSRSRSPIDNNRDKERDAGSDKDD